MSEALLVVALGALLAVVTGDWLAHSDQIKALRYRVETLEIEAKHQGEMRLLMIEAFADYEKRFEMIKELLRPTVPKGEGE